MISGKIIEQINMLRYLRNGNLYGREADVSKKIAKFLKILNFFIVPMTIYRCEAWILKKLDKMKISAEMNEIYEKNSGSNSRRQD